MISLLFFWQCFTSYSKYSTCIIFDSSLFPALYDNMTSSRKPEVHNGRGGPSHGHNNTYRKLVTFGRVVFEIRKRTDKQTDTHTSTLITILRNCIGGEVTNVETFYVCDADDRAGCRRTAVDALRCRRDVRRCRKRRRRPRRRRRRRPAGAGHRQRRTGRREWRRTTSPTERPTQRLQQFHVTWTQFDERCNWW